MNLNNALNATSSLLSNSLVQGNKIVTSILQSNILERISHIVRSVEQKRDAWSEHALSFFDQVSLKLDALPNLTIQNKFDGLVRHIENTFVPLGKFNEWLNSNGFGAWYRQLAIFLVKLPLRAARNILQMLYQIVKGCFYFAVHPLKSLVQLAKLMVRLLTELTKPETWSKIGGGCLGSSFGQSLVTGNPLSLVGIGIGAACLLGGLSIGALRAALLAQAGNRAQGAWTNFTDQLKQLPETALTGFLMGVMIGAVQNAVCRNRMNSWKITNYEEAKQYIDEFIKEQNLPAYSSIHLENGKIVITWADEALQKLEQSFPDFFSKYHSTSFPGHLESFSIEVSRANSHGIVNVRVWQWDGFEDASFDVPCEHVGITGPSYPLPPNNIILPNAGSEATIAGAIVGACKKTQPCQESPLNP
jgi:hypothetical protein